MGDTGALASGALLATIALLGNRELLLPICGSVFLIETISVIAQVVWFRRTKTRLLLCSPLHNHFVFRKVPEPTIVYCFWAVSCISAVIASICFG
jgi:phospho-N-acetylmuramoyl-pentapeptide-transferase